MLNIGNIQVPAAKPVSAPVVAEQINSTLNHEEPKWEEVIDPQLKRQKQQVEEARKAAEAQIAAEEAARAEAARRVLSRPAPAPSVTSFVRVQSGLLGYIGYALSYGNCVNEPGVNNPGAGNPISWSVLYMSPRVGATALFTWNHVGVVSGIWSNGDLEIRHQNCPGCPSRYPLSMFRGFR